jgi:hypothetical protein
MPDQLSQVLFEFLLIDVFRGDLQNEGLAGAIFWQN